MATLIFSAVGQALGGPVGAIIGTFAGSYIDQQLLGAAAPRSRSEGPRLSDLTVQASTYGKTVPLVYGQARVAGNIIWSTGLQEASVEGSVGRGKGRSGVSTTTYTYSASFAVALSARAITGIKRIWADGKLIRPENGPLTVGGEWRLYLGSELQPVDPLIEAALGVDQSPACRGLAYVVFEDLQLAEFANRIPNLTFEVVADDDEPVGLAAIASDLLKRASVRSADTTALSAHVHGLVLARQTSGRTGLEAMGAVAALRSVSTGNMVRLTDALAATPLTIPRQLLGTRDPEARDQGSLGRRRHVTRLQVADLPRELAFVYADPARDYQIGLQRARRSGASSSLVEQREVPLALSADEAKRAAERSLSQRWRERNRLKVHVPWTYLALEPGDIVRLTDQPGTDWEITDSVIEAGRIELDLIPVSAADRISLAEAEAGSVPSQSASEHGPTQLQVFELPAMTSATPTAAQVHLAMAGAQTGWRSASLFTSQDGGASYTALGASGGRTVMGTARAGLAAADHNAMDVDSALEVDLIAPDMVLAAASDISLLAGANLALVGAELVQFGQVDLLPDGGYRLSRLLRGRRGTEAAVGQHFAGEAFVLLSAAPLATWQPSAAAPGAAVRFKALSPYQSIGDVSPVEHVISGRGLRPLSPVFLRAERPAAGVGAGDLRLTWIRRSRSGFDWPDWVDSPLGEETEAYQVSVYANGDVLRSWTAAVPEQLYTQAEQLADFGSLPASIDVSVSQLSAVVGLGEMSRRTIPVEAI